MEASEETTFTGHGHVEPTQISTDAKVDTLADCVKVLTQQLELLTQANNRVEPLHVQIKKEHVTPEIVDISLNTSDEEEKNDSVRFRTSTVKFEHVEKARTSVDNSSSGGERSESPITDAKP